MIGKPTMCWSCLGVPSLVFKADLMTLPRTRQSGFHRALALLALVPACAWFSAPVQAGCAHPAGAIQNGMADFRLDSLRLLGVLDADSKTSPIETPWAPQPDRPCSGPNCKRDTAPSEAPSHVSILLRIECYLAASGLDRSPRLASHLRPVEPVLSSTHAVNALERPPRALNS